MDTDEFDNYKIVATIGEVSTNSNPSMFLQGDPQDGLENSDIVSIGKIGFTSKSKSSNPSKRISETVTTPPIITADVNTPASPSSSNISLKKQKRNASGSKSNLSYQINTVELESQIKQIVETAIASVLPSLFNQAYQAYAENISKLDNVKNQKDMDSLEDITAQQHMRKAKIIIHDGALTFDFDYTNINTFDDFIIISLPDTEDSFGLKFTDTQDLALQYCNDQSNTITQKGIFIGNPFKPTNNSNCKLLIFLKDSGD